MDLKEFFYTVKKDGILSSVKREESVGQFVRYIAVGLMAAAVEYGLTIALTELAGLWFLFSSAAGYTAGFIISFVLNRTWSFKSRGNVIRQLVLYLVLFLLNLAVSNGLLYLLVTYAGIIYPISKALVMGMVVIWNFLLYKRVIYR